MLNSEMGILFEHLGLAAALRDEYERLASPATSHRVQLDTGGQIAWLDPAAKPPAHVNREPDAGLGLRVMVKLLRWLPIESQL